jgi:PTS system nitrogen regulatory IIA component
MQLTSRDAARLLDVTEEVLERWVRRGELPAERVDDQYRFNRVELLEWAAQRKLPVSAEILEDPGLASRGLSSLSEAVRAGGIHRGLGGGDRDALLRAMVERLPVPPGTDREFLFQMVLAREHLGSTAVGHGFAIPHPREPIVLRVDRPAVAVFLLDDPADLGAPDGRPVHTVCLLVSPSTRAHLHLLAALGSALRDPAVARALETRAPPAEVLAEIERVEQGMALRRAEGVVRSDRA